MKGSPRLRIVLILLLLGVVFWPVFKITKTAGSSSYAPSQIPTTPTPPIDSVLSATLLVHTAPTPLKCSVSQGGIILLSETNFIAPGEYRSSARIKKGEDLLVTAEWKDTEPHALRAEILVHGYQAHLEKSFWAQQQLEDTLPIPESFLP